MSKVNQPFRPNQVKNAVKFHPSNKAEVEFKVDENFKEYLTVFMGGPGVTSESFTIHHPIGVTRLDKNEWVSTRTTDVHFLLSGAEDPDSQRFSKLRDIEVLKFLLGNGHLVGTLDKPLYPTGKVSGEVDRNFRLNLAKKELEKFDLSELEKHKKEQEGKPKPAKWRGSGKTVYDFMAEDMKQYEKSLKEISSKDPNLREKIKIHHSNYETLGGPSRTEPQLPITFLKGMDANRASSQIFSKIREMFLKPEEGEEIRPPAASPPTPANAGAGVEDSSQKLQTLEKKHLDLLKESKDFSNRAKAWLEKAQAEAFKPPPGRKAAQTHEVLCELLKSFPEIPDHDL